jgi:2,4-dienoyl-CoA reductase-like NADH-dependent reductase (Old Yellow Enzyme family)
MALLFEPTEINELKLPNRFIRAATWEGMAGEDGACRPELVDLMVELAAGQAGLLISGHVYVDQAGQATNQQLGLDRDSHINGLRTLTSAVRREGGRIIAQLAHGGLRADEKFSGHTPMGPSTGEGQLETPGREMAVADINQVVEAFGQAARRAQTAGFDGVQIHAAHGYLLSQFLSPAFNRRTDDYGGDILKRTRILLEVLQSIRQAVGASFPVLAKINSQDFIDHGLNPEDALRVGVMLDRAGIDAIELSGGTMLSGKFVPFRKEIAYERDQAYFRRVARALKARIKVPVILVGGIRSYLLAERLVAENFTDYISLCRPLIREPRLIERWQSGDLRKATCVSCNGCLAAARSGQGIYCVLEKNDHH